MQSLSWSYHQKESEPNNRPKESIWVVRGRKEEEATGLALLAVCHMDTLLQRLGFAFEVKVTQVGGDRDQGERRSTGDLSLKGAWDLSSVLYSEWGIRGGRSWRGADTLRCLLPARHGCCPLPATATAARDGVKAKSARCTHVRKQSGEGQRRSLPCTCTRMAGKRVACLLTPAVRCLTQLWPPIPA